MPDALHAALLRELHRSISQAVDVTMEQLARGAARGLDYPPGDGKSDDHVLTDEEVAALAHLASSDVAVRALRKLLREAAASPLFDLFSLLDGVTAPDGWTDEAWLGAALVPRTGDEYYEMLHDEFFASYHDRAVDR